MSIAWGSLLVVAVVSLGVGVAVVALVAFALVGLSARVASPVGRPHHRPPLGRGAGTTVAGLCLTAAVLTVGYGLYLILA